MRNPTVFCRLAVAVALALLFRPGPAVLAADLTWTPPYPKPPGQVMFGWPRAEVHKRMGRPLAAHIAGTDTAIDLNKSFEVSEPVEDTWERRTPLNRWKIQVVYNSDPTAKRSGLVQRSNHLIIEPEQPLALWALLDDAAGEVSEAVEICHGACELSRITTPEEEYALAFPMNPTEEQNTIGVLVKTGYKPYDTGERWTAGLKFVLKPESWNVVRIEIIPVGHLTSVRPGPDKTVEHIGLWRPR